MWAHPAGYCFRVELADVHRVATSTTRWFRTKRLETAVARLAMRLPWTEWDHNPPHLPTPQAVDFDDDGNAKVWGLDIQRCDGAPLVYHEAKYVADRFDISLDPPYNNRKFWMTAWRREAPLERQKARMSQRRVP